MNINQLPRVNYDMVVLGGGLDQVTPNLALRPGVARRAANFEAAITGGYTRIAGYERFDGHEKPSDATYSILTCNLTGSVAVGNTVVGYSSAVTAKVIYVVGNAIVVTRESGFFTVGEAITVSGAVIGEIVDISALAADGHTDAVYSSLAADEYRASIGEVPGSGPIRGVAYYAGNVYAWRNNAGGTALTMYKSSPSGWTPVALGKELSFDGGAVEILEGATVVGATSGATGVARRVIVQSGSWGGVNLAVGKIIFTTLTGTFIDNENIKVGTTVCAVANGASSQMTWAPNGTVRSSVANFGGGQTNRRLYFCDGVNRGFEFDGTYLVPISTSMTPDAPTRLAVHKQHLFFAFNHSLQFSAIGNPYSWDPVLGAGEIALNSPITDLLILPGDQTSGALAVFTQTDTSVLYGSSSENFALTTFNVGTGAYPSTAQNLDQAYIFSDRGIVALGTSLNFGNFLSQSLTMNIRTFVQQHRQQACASVTNREKGQYRVFFSDGTGLYMTMSNNTVIGVMPVQFPNAALCFTDTVIGDGPEYSFFGSDNGFVYQLDAGTSFDGDVIPANITLAYNSQRSPRILKRYRKASIELTGTDYAEFGFSYDLGYRTQEISQPDDQDFSNDLRSAYWDSFDWDNFVFDGRETSPSEIELNGTAENIAIRIFSLSNLFKPFTVNSVILHYTMRRGLR